MAQLLYGKNVVKQILSDSRKVNKVYLTSSDAEIIAMCRKQNVTVQMCDRQMLTKMCKTDRHQGVAAETDPYRTYSVNELLKGVKTKDRGLLIMLDQLEDPHNLGAVLRTADAVGADGVIFKKDRAVGLTPTVAKVSAGAIDTVKCAEVTNLVTTLQDLQKQNWWAVGTDMDAQDYRSLAYDRNIVLIIGSEGKGISRLLWQKCDYVVSIPMVGKITSLNASVSAGILMYEIYSSRFPL